MKPQLEFLMNLAVDVGEIVSMGDGPLGERRVVGILGGTFEGPELRGTVLAGGADWQIVRKDGVLDLDARYALKEARGLVRVTSQGYRHGAPEVLAALARGDDVDPGKYFFRTVMRFETGESELDWLNKTIAVATAERGACLRRPPRPGFDVAICDIKSPNSASLSWNMKSTGNLARLRRTCSFRRRVCTPYSAARSASRMILCPRTTKIRPAIASTLAEGSVRSYPKMSDSPASVFLRSQTATLENPIS